MDFLIFYFTLSSALYLPCMHMRSRGKAIRLGVHIYMYIYVIIYIMCVYKKLQFSELGI